MAMEAANLAGLSHAGAPVMMRGSTARPITATASAGIIKRPVAVRGALLFQSLFNTAVLLGCNVITVNINIDECVDTVNIKTLRWSPMVRSAGNRPKKKKAGQYHHGDLRSALLEEAVRTIQTDGVDELTLRAVGAALGVSRTALYRHFSDKQALLAAVGREGFRMLRLALT